MVPPRGVTINQNTEVFHIMFLFKISQYLQVIVIHSYQACVERDDKIRAACV